MFNPNNPYGPDLNTPSNVGNQYRYHPSNPAPRSYCRPRSRGFLRFLLFPIVVILFVIGGMFSLGNHPNYAPPSFLEQLPMPVLLLGAIGVFIVLMLLQKIFRRTLLGRLLSGIIGTMMIAIIAVALCWTLFINPYVDMTATTFTRASVSINNGGTLHFRNPTNGITQLLCSGINQKCQAEKGAPTALQQGLRVQPGQTIDVNFDADGTYHITSKNTPGMNITIDVSTPDNSGGD